MGSEQLRLLAEVSDALAAERPVVALESTVIAQGLPWPENLQTAQAAEAAVRAVGATPATIAVLGGVIHAGLSQSECETLAKAAPSLALSHNHNDSRHQLRPPEQLAFFKANRRDLSSVVARRQNAATTVSATLWLARRLGLAPLVMATGGLGGVHRDAAVTHDVSTDLDELGRADGALVVCSGFKSILDLPATLESLETRGVAIVGYRTPVLPGFLAHSAGLPLEHRVDTPAQAAEIVQAHRDLALPGAIVLVQPVPQGSALEEHILNKALDAALERARLGNVRGKGLTPFLLDAVRRETGGAGLAANCALLVSNARLAGEIAVAICERERSRAPLTARLAPGGWGARPDE